MIQIKNRRETIDKLKQLFEDYNDTLYEFIDINLISQELSKAQNKSNHFHKKDYNKFVKNLDFEVVLFNPIFNRINQFAKQLRGRNEKDELKKMKNEKIK